MTQNDTTDSSIEGLSEREIAEEFASRLLRADPDRINFNPDADWRGFKQAVEFLIEVRSIQADADSDTDQQGE